MQLPPAVEADYRPQDDYGPTMRGAAAVVELLRAGDKGMSTAEIAQALRMSRSGAWRMMDHLCNVVECGVYYDSPEGGRGRWFLMVDGKLGLRAADGFERNPPMR